MDHLFKISKQTIWQILGKIVTSFSTLIILGIIARRFGESGTGVFTLTLTYLAIFFLISDFGFNAHVLKNLQKTNWQKLLGIRIAWSLLLAGLSIALLPFLSFASVDFINAVILGSLSIIPSAIFITCNLIFQSKHRYDLSIIASSTGILIGLMLYFWFSSLALPIPLLLIAYLISWLIIATTSLFFVKRFVSSIWPIFDYQYTVNLFKKTWPIAVTLGLNVVYFRADSFLVTFYKGVAEAGVYNIAYLVFQSALVLPTFIMNAYYPLMLKSLSKIRLMGLILLGLSVLATIITIIFAPLIISLLTGKGFLGATKSLQILSLGFPAFFVSSLLMWLLVTKNRYKKMLLVYGAGLLLNLGLNIIFIPKFSYIAASWITVLSEYLILALLIAIL